MIVTFWGVRGSTPVPGPDTLRYGGNTACVAVEIEDRILIIDAGTGIRRLGNELLEHPKEVFLLLTHPHSDHTVGFPFFAPLYQQGSRSHILDYEHEGRSFSLFDLFDGMHVPMRRAQMSRGCRQCADEPLSFLKRHGFETAMISLNHPGGALGYRITHDGRSFAHLTDNELRASEPTTAFEQFVAFCHGADVLSHDAQYIDTDLPDKSGWGHSTVADACELAIAAHVRCLVLFHQDPDRTDDEVDAIQADARKRLQPHGIDCIAAYEGLRIDLTSSAEVAVSGAGAEGARRSGGSRRIQH
jgi:phosphoribosyl 1,2-cyclic phosphodiesterase